MTQQTRRICWLPALPDEGWASMDRYWRELACCAAAVPHPGVVPAAPDYLGSPPTQSQASGRICRAWKKHFLYPLKVRQERADLFHVLDHSYAHLIPHAKRRGKVIATVFDLVPLECPDGMTPGQVRRFHHCVAHLRSADHLISISAETRHKLDVILGIPPERVTVAVPGVDFGSFDAPVPMDNAVATRLRGLPPIILSVGSTLPRKNLESLPGIFSHLAGEFASGRCVFVRAGARLGPELRFRIEQVVGPQGFIELGPLFGVDLIAAYQAARIFVFPSTLEGLTFTIPEAMAAGCAVVTNRETANPEAGGDVALYYDEGDGAGAATLVRRLLEDDAFCAGAQQRGVARARELTWMRHYQTVLGVYDRLLGTGGPKS